MKLILSFVIGALVAALATGFALGGFAAHPKGATVLTVTGSVAQPNRGALDPFGDAFLASAGARFERARAFSRADLVKLGMNEVRARYPSWPQEIVLRGPTLKAVLAAAGAEGEVLVAKALDGYAARLDLRAAADAGAILAVEAEGVPLGIGGRGPTWLVYPPGAVAGVAADDESPLVWSAYWLHVE